MTTLRGIERWIKKRTRALRGLDIVEKSSLSFDTVTLGSEYGGWTMCPIGIGPKSVVYSGGVGSDISFDLELIRHFGATVHAFDPTPHVIDWIAKQKLPEAFVFHEYGITDNDGECQLYLADGPPSVDSHSVIAKPDADPTSITVPMKSMSTIMQTLGHTHIDILKMDVEGSEWSIIPDIISRGVEVYQLLVEFHHLEFRNAGIRPTKECLQLLKDNAYRLFSVSEKGQEYSFIREDILRRKRQTDCQARRHSLCVTDS